jgi:hypothetical protein
MSGSLIAPTPNPDKPKAPTWAEYAADPGRYEEYNVGEDGIGSFDWIRKCQMPMWANMEDYIARHSFGEEFILGHPPTGEDPGLAGFVALKPWCVCYQIVPKTAMIYAANENRHGGIPINLSRLGPKQREAMGLK